VSETIDLQMERVVPLESEKADTTTARTITSLSADALKRNYPDMVVQLSPRREGMRVCDALKIARGEALKSKS
jgi:hypothetical protein